MYFINPCPFCAMIVTDKLTAYKLKDENKTNSFFYVLIYLAS